MKLHLLNYRKEGLAPTTIPHVMEVEANIEDHATISHQAIFNALRLLYVAPAKGK
jgi:hypothetical protein